MLPRTLVAQDRTVLKRAREYSVDESRSAIPGQGGDPKPMALHMLSGGKTTNAAHSCAHDATKLPIHASSLNTQP